jgi:hypothetical protein
VAPVRRNGDIRHLEGVFSIANARAHGDNSGDGSTLDRVLDLRL